MRIRKLIALAVASVVVLAACGDDDETTAGTADAGADAPATAQELSGEPVTYWLITDDRPELTFPENEAAARAAADEVNASGGIAGSPAEVSACATKGDPNGAVECARQVAADPSAIGVFTFTSHIAGVIPVLQEAGIPLVGHPITADDFGCDICFTVSSGAVGSTGGLAVAADRVLGATTANLVILDVPAGRQLAGLLEGIIGANQLDLKLGQQVFVPLGAADLSSQVAAAAQGGDAILVILPTDLAGRFAITARQQGIDLPMVGAASSFTEQVRDEAGAAVEGMIITSNYPVDGEASEHFRDALTEQGADLPVTEVARSAYLGVHLLARASASLESADSSGMIEALNRLTGWDSFGATPPLDFTKSFTGFGGRFPRMFNNTISIAMIQDGELVGQGNRFEVVIPA